MESDLAGLASVCVCEMGVKHGFDGKGAGPFHRVQIEVLHYEGSELLL